MEGEVPLAPRRAEASAVGRGAHEEALVAGDDRGVAAQLPGGGAGLEGAARRERVVGVVAPGGERLAGELIRARGSGVEHDAGIGTGAPAAARAAATATRWADSCLTAFRIGGRATATDIRPVGGNRCPSNECPSGAASGCRYSKQAMKIFEDLRAGLRPAVERLVEGYDDANREPLTRRELLVEGLTAAAFLVTACLMAALLPAGHQLDPVLAVALTVAYARGLARALRGRLRLHGPDAAAVRADAVPAAAVGSVPLLVAAGHRCWAGCRSYLRGEQHRRAACWWAMGDCVARGRAGARARAWPGWSEPSLARVADAAGGAGRADRGRQRGLHAARVARPGDLAALEPALLGLGGRWWTCCCRRSACWRRWPRSDELYAVLLVLPLAGAAGRVRAPSAARACTRRSS